MTKTLLSIGHGYSAQALADLLLPLGWHIIGTTRSAERAAQLDRAGIEPLIWPGTPLPLSRATHLLCSVAPGPEGDPVLADHAPDIAQATHLDWVGYLSTTGVYGDHGGAWVDEDTPLTPSTARGRARVAAEVAWQNAKPYPSAYPAAGRCNLRPGRGPFAKVARGQAAANASSNPDRCFRAFTATISARRCWLQSSRTRALPSIIYAMTTLPRRKT